MAYTPVVPNAKSGLDRLKFETASEIGVSLKDGYNGDITAVNAGRIGGQMVKKLIQKAEQTL